MLLDPDTGEEYALADIQYLYECRSLLSPRQKQSIELFLYDNVLEKEAARIMGVSETNPVAMYATHGLRRICEMAEQGLLPRYLPPEQYAPDRETVDA